MSAAVREKQFSNADVQIVLRERGKFMSWRDLHLLNAWPPILTTLFDIETLVSEVQPRNALIPIAVTLLSLIHI